MHTACHPFLVQCKLAPIQSLMNQVGLLSFKAEMELEVKAKGQEEAHRLRKHDTLAIVAYAYAKKNFKRWIAPKAYDKQKTR